MYSVELIHVSSQATRFGFIAYLHMVVSGTGMNSVWLSNALVQDLTPDYFFSTTWPV